MLVDWILNGRQPKVPAKYTKVISFEDSGVDVVAVINTLQALGFSEKEAKERINVAVRDGFKHDEEILKCILSQR